MVPQTAPIEHTMSLDAARLLRIADRLGDVDAGGSTADKTIHQALGLAGPVQAYTSDDDVARSLLPAGFEWLPPVYSAGAIYAACRRAGVDGDLLHPHAGQWGRTLALAMCGAVMRGHVIARRAAQV